LWLFIANELMLFGGLFMALTVYRIIHTETTRAASEHLHLWIGGANTAVLLTSSLTMVLAVLAARAGDVRTTVRMLLATAAIGAVFLALKGWEYRLEYDEGLMPGVGPVFPLGASQELFFNFYFVSTGLHAVHLALGIGAVLFFAARLHRGRMDLPHRSTMIEGLGMYWHFVDVVWVFLYPVLYLI